MENPDLKVLGGATMLIGSDAYPYTIVRISDRGLTFWMRADKTTRIDKNGLSENQTWSYESDPNGEEKMVRLNQNGDWRHKQDFVVLLGVRKMYQDPSF